MSDKYKFTEQFLDAYWRLFIPTNSKYLLQYKSKEQVLYRTVNKRFKQSNVVAMLHGKITIGFYPLLPDKITAKYLVIDIDDTNRDYINKVKIMLLNDLQIDENSVHTLFSGKKGYHLYLCLERPLQAEIVIAVGRKLQDKMKVLNRDLSEPFEIRPESLSGRGIKAPLAKHLGTGVCSHFVDSKYKRIHDQYGYVISILEKRIAPDVFTNYLTAEETVAVEEDKAADVSDEAVDFKDILPPCLTAVVDNPITRPGIRHYIINAIARWLFTVKNIPINKIQRYIEGWYLNHKGAALTSVSDNSKELWNILKSLNKSGNFNCNASGVKDILKPNCNKDICPLNNSLYLFQNHDSNLLHHPEFHKLNPTTRIIFIELLVKRKIAENQGSFTYKGKTAFYATASNIAINTGLPLRSVQRHLDKLSETGWIEKIPFNDLIKFKPWIIKNGHNNMLRFPNYYILTEYNNMIDSMII